MPLIIGTVLVTDIYIYIFFFQRKTPYLHGPIIDTLSKIFGSEYNPSSSAPYTVMIVTTRTMKNARKTFESYIV